MRSLRARVAIASAAVVGISLFSGGALIGLLRNRDTEREFAEVVKSRLLAVAADTEVEDGRLKRRSGGDDGPDEGWSLRAADGRLILGQDWLGKAPPRADLHSPVLSHMRWPDGGDGMAAWAWFIPEDDEHVHHDPISVAVVLRSDDLDQRQRQLRTTLLVGGLATALVTAGALALVLGRLLRPHAQLADAIAGLDPHRQGQRLPEEHLPAELRPVAARINELCDRLERAYGLALSVHSAAAHELRTPLAGMRATIEVAQAPGGDATAALATCHQISLRMQARIDNLLMASRLDAGQVSPCRDEVDLHTLLRQAWEVQDKRATERRLEVEWSLAGAGLVEGDAEALRMVLANLLDNAVSHSLVGGRIGIACHDAGGWTVLLIGNPSSISPDDAPRVFERGWRGKGAAASGRHAGLGMGICRELVGLMHGNITSAAADGRFTVTIRLPAPGEFAYW